MLIDERTLGRYKRLYLEYGVAGLLADNYKGGFFKLNNDQIAFLKKELDSKPYSTSAEICEYVKKTFLIRYTHQGMVQTLHKIGYSYKKTSPIPGKIDIEKQNAFIDTNEKEYKSLPENEKVYFLDSSHPTFNNYFGYAWIKKETDFLIKTQDGRKHLNLMGAYNPKDQETVIKNYETLNREAVLDFLRILRKNNQGYRLHIIWDNVPYQHARDEKLLAEDLNINLVYLPVGTDTESFRFSEALGVYDLYETSVVPIALTSVSVDDIASVLYSIAGVVGVLHPLSISTKSSTAPDTLKKIFIHSPKIVPRVTILENNLMDSIL